MTNNILSTYLIGFILLTLVTSGHCAEDKPEGKYEATWESLSRHKTPEWLMDAKLGIYAHWGLYAVPAHRGPAYGKEMYQEGSEVYEFHKKHYGSPAEFGYKDFVNGFTAEKFNPARWAELIEGSGAKFAGICVVHHDGFGLWDSDVYGWNAGKVGPKRNLYGELVRHIRKRGLKVAATFHHARSFNWFLPREYSEEVRKKWDVFDPAYKEIYWNEVTGSWEEFVHQWQAKVREVLARYKPDFLWFDGMRSKLNNDALLNRTVRNLFADYFNQALERGVEVDIANKLPAGGRFNFPKSFGLLCYENNRDRPELPPRVWLTDRAMGYPWGYVKGKSYIPVDDHLNSLVDIVSRGGIFMLSLTPKANGEIPAQEKHIMSEMGKWLKINGEAIYGTRPWETYGEGPTEMKEMRRGHVKWNYRDMTARDIRFTRKNNTLYAVALDWPDDGKLTVRTLSSNNRISTGGISSVSLLGYPGELEWSRDADGLFVVLPNKPPCGYAYALRIELKGKLLD